MITLTDGQEHLIQFDYNSLNDNPQKVAQEMVDELEIESVYLDSIDDPSKSLNCSHRLEQVIKLFIHLKVNIYT